MDDSHTSQPFQHGRRTGKSHYPFPDAFNQNVDNPNAFVGQLMKDTFIQVVADSLDKQAEYNKKYVNLPTYSEPESVFFSVSRPDIPTRDYIDRLVTYTQCSPSAFVVMLIYLDRVAISNSSLHVTPFNMHRLLVTALTLACKVLDDRCFSNVHYAKVGGIPSAREMNRLELQFLAYVKYRLHVTHTIYHDKLRSLESRPPPPRVPVLYKDIPLATHIDPMVVASPVTPGSQMVLSPRSTTISSFVRPSSTVSTTGGSQNVGVYPSKDQFRTSIYSHYRGGVYEANSFKDETRSHDYMFPDSRSRSPPPNGKRPRSRCFITS